MGIGATGWLAIGEAAISAIVSPLLNWKDSKDAQDRIGKADDDSSTTLYGQLNRSYEQSKLELETDFKQKNTTLNNAINYTSKLRSQNANFASSVNVKNNQMMYEDLAIMLEEVTRSEGDVVQNMAMTGFRNSEGTTQKQVVIEAGRTSQYQIDRAVNSLKVNSAQAYYQASSDYWSATSQIEQYKVEVKHLQESYKVAKDSLDVDYENKKQELKSAYEDAEYEWWEGVLDFVTLGLRGTSNVLSTIDANNMSVTQKELIDIQIKDIKASNPNISLE